MSKAPRSPLKKSWQHSTGIDPEEFVRLGWNRDGSWFVKTPHRGNDYDQVSVGDLSWRIRSDIGELVARAYAIFEHQWQAPDHWGNWARDLIRSSKKEEINKIRPGLWKMLRSSNERTVRKARTVLVTALSQRCQAESTQAAEVVARLALFITDELLSLTNERQSLLQKIAKQFESWPVNLGVKSKSKVKDGHTSIVPILTGVEWAKSYLFGLGVNLPQPIQPEKHDGISERSIFHHAADVLYRQLLRIKNSPRCFFLKPPTKRKGWSFKISAWGQRLISMSEPMTRGKSSDKWWALAKVLLDELWEERRETFKPLIRHLKFDEGLHTPSLVRKQVIDDSLKKAFKALAVPAEQ
jgi:hypothetical protein